MTTVINNPGGSNDSGSGAGLVIGVIVAIVLIFALIRWGIPAMRGSDTEEVNIKVELPASTEKTAE